MAPNTFIFWNYTSTSSLHKILEDKQVQVATIQCYTRSFQPQQSHTGVASFMDKLRRYESAYKYWRLGRVESCSGKGPLIRVLSTLLQYLIKSESQTKVSSMLEMLVIVCRQKHEGEGGSLTSSAVWWVGTEPREMHQGTIHWMSEFWTWPRNSLHQ